MQGTLARKDSRIESSPCRHFHLRRAAWVWTASLLTLAVLAAPASAAVDLAISNLTWTPDPVQPGDQVTFSAVVANSGNDPVTGNFLVGFQVNGVSITTGAGVLVT